LEALGSGHGMYPEVKVVDVGVSFIINSNLSLILKKSSGLTNPDAKPQLRPSMDPFFNRK
jgi:hypothetical protein